MGILSSGELTACCLCSPGSARDQDSCHTEAVCCAFYRICTLTFLFQTVPGLVKFQGWEHLQESGRAQVAFVQSPSQCCQKFPRSACIIPAITVTNGDIQQMELMFGVSVCGAHTCVHVLCASCVQPVSLERTTSAP